jgi:hypothetical protein
MRIEIKNEALNRQISLSRLIGSVISEVDGPTVVFTAGLHGNESAGVIALVDAFEEIQKGKLKFRGNVYAIAGNLPALEQNKRFIEQDLNRNWRLNQIQQNQINHTQQSIEQGEQREILNHFERILNKHSGPFIFIDLHTTSARTVPYITINDTLENRRLSFKFPLPVILGIESFIQGPMLSFINEMGHRAIGFEAGQHDQQHTYQNHLSFFWLSLVNAGVLSKKSLPQFDEIYQRLLIAAQGHKQVYEVGYRYEVSEGEDFRMVPGYSNFHPVQKGQYLAETNHGNILCENPGHIFMPRYEEQGNDGFYVVHKVTQSWLNLSALLRKLNFESLLVYLPGIRKQHAQGEEIEVNPHIARFFTTELFHLLGYRNQIKSNGKVLFSKRNAQMDN